MCTRSLIVILAFLVFAFTELKAQMIPGSTTLSVSATPKVSQAYHEKAELGESNGTFGANLQLEVNYQYNRGFAVGIGVKYSYDRLEARNYTPILACDIDPVSGPDVFNSWFEDEYTATYIGIPISFRFYLGGQKPAIYTRLGYEFLFRVATDQESVLRSCGENSVTVGQALLGEFNRNASKLSLGLGLMFGNEDKRIRFFLEPEIAYWATRVFQEEGSLGSLPNNIRLLDIGLRTGIFF